MTRGHSVFAKIRQPVARDMVAPGAAVVVNDVILHALLVRVALSNGENAEFKTVFDKHTNTLDLEIPPNAIPVLNQITGMQRGPNLQTFINWLIGSQTLVTPAQQSDNSFVPSSALDNWVGAQSSDIGSYKLVLVLPTVDAAIIGYNIDTPATFSGKIRISLLWTFIAGSNTSFNLKTQTSVTDKNGAINVTTSALDISTVNLISGDVRQTVLQEIDNIGGSSVANILFFRNYVGSPDPQTESVAVIGLRVELVAG